VEAGFLWACQHGRKEVVEYLLDRGVDPNADGGRMNGLHCAAVGGQLEIVRLLLARNFPLESLNAYGGTALGAALWGSVNAPRPDHLRIIETLVDAGAQVDERWFAGRRPEIEAALRRPRGGANSGRPGPGKRLS
jgi:ankyrin repeat protein